MGARGRDGEQDFCVLRKPRDFRGGHVAMTLTPSCPREGLYKVSSDLSYMERGRSRYDRYTVLLPLLTCGALAQPNQMWAHEVQATNLSAEFGDLESATLPN